MARVWRAQLEEADTVAGLLVEFRDHWGRSWPPDESLRRDVRRLIERDDTEYLLGADGSDEPAAVCQLRYRYGIWWAAEDCWLEDLYVRESARGAGLGLALGEAAIARARERGCARVELDVAEANTAARRLYERLGFGDSKGRSLFLGKPLREPGS